MEAGGPTGAFNDWDSCDAIYGNIRFHLCDPVLLDSPSSQTNLARIPNTALGHEISKSKSDAHPNRFCRVRSNVGHLKLLAKRFQLVVMVTGAEF
ncbi:MAG: hypothetical protein RLN78_07155 [Phycisphaerales bacterium]